MPKKQVPTKNLVLYKAPNDDIELRGDFGHETIWATQAEIVRIFQVDQSVVSRHIRNIFKDGEVDEKSNMQEMHIANSDKPVAVYSLDVILSVGYKVNSKQATQFRQWATKTLKQYLLEGYVLNKKQIKKNHQAFLKSIADIQVLLLRYSTTSGSYCRK